MAKIVLFILLTSFCFGQGVNDLDSLRNVFEHSKDTLNRIDAGRRLWFTELNFYNFCIYDRKQYLEKVKYYGETLTPMEIAYSEAPVRFTKEIDQMVYKMEFYQYTLKFDSLIYMAELVHENLKRHIELNPDKKTIDRVISLITYEAILVSYHDDMQESVSLFIEAIDLSYKYKLKQREILVRFQLANFLLHNFYNDPAAKLRAFAILDRLKNELEDVDNSDILNKIKLAEDIRNLKLEFQNDREQQSNLYLDPYSIYLFGGNLYNKLDEKVKKYFELDQEEIQPKISILREIERLLLENNFKNIYLYWQVQYYLGKHYFELSNYEISCQYFGRLNDLFEENKYINTAYFNYEEMYAIMKVISEKRHNFQDAYKYANLEYQYSLRSKENASTSVTNIVSTYEARQISELENEITIQQAKVTRSNFLISFLVLGLLFFTVLLYLKLKSNKMLNTKNVQLNSSIREKERLQDKIEKIQESIVDELHDNFGNRLSGIISSHDILKEINAKEANFDQINFDYFSDLLEKNLKNFTNDIKDLLWVSKKENNSLRKLIDRIDKFVQDISSESSVEIELQVNLRDKDYELPRYWNRQLLLITKEAVNNTLKHAEAKKITIALKVDEHNKLRIEMTDDGKGFECASLTRISGLNNMKTRAEIIDCKFDVETAKDVGTKVIVEGSF